MGFAATNWDGGGGANQNWDVALNWDTNVTPLNDGTADLVFGGSTGLSPVITGPWSINSLTFASGASAFTIGGTGPLTVGAGGIDSFATNTQIVAAPIFLGAAQTWTAGTASYPYGLLFINGPVANQGFDLTLESLSSGSSDTNRISGAISGTGGLTKTGGGSWTLSGTNSNTYTGLTMVKEGGLKLGKTGGSTAVAGNLAVGLAAGPTVSLTLDASNQIADTATLTIDRSGSFYLQGYVETVNTLNLFGGQISSGTLNVLGEIRLRGGSTSSSLTLGLGGNVISEAYPTAATLGGINLGGASRTFAVADGPANLDLEIDGLVSNGGIIKTGPGTMTLGGSNTFAGGMVVNEGRLIIEGSSALGLGSLTLNDGTTLGFGYEANPTSPIVFNGAIRFEYNSSSSVRLTGPLAVKGQATLNIASSSLDLNFAGNLAPELTSSTLTKIGPGTLSLSGDNSYAGTILIQEGRVRLLHVNGLGATANGTVVAAGATLELGAISGIGETITLNGSGSNSAGALSIPSGLSAGLNGDVIIASPSSIRLGDGFSSSNPTILVMNGTVVANAALTLDVSSNATATFAAKLSGSGNVVKSNSGTLILGGVNDYSGGLQISSGVVKLASATALSASSSGTIVNDAGRLDLNGFAVQGGKLYLNGQSSSGQLANSSSSAASFNGEVIVATASSILASLGGISLGGPVILNSNLSVNSTTTTTIGGSMSGSGSLSKSGTGKLILQGSNSYTGTTSLNSGTIEVSGGNAIPNASTVSIDTNATLRLFANEEIGGLSGSGALDLGSAQLASGGSATTTFSGVISGIGGFEKKGIGTLTLSGANSFSGNVLISGGVLRLGSLSALGSSTNMVVGDGGSLDLAGFSLSTALTLNGAGGTNGGALNNSSTAAGSALISGPVLLASPSTIRASGSGGLTFTTGIGGGQTLTVVADSSSTITINGPLDLGSGGLIKTGTGTLTLSGALANTNTGATTVLGGILALGQGGVAISGNLAIGDTATSGTRTVRLLADSQISPTAAVTIVGSGASLDLNGFNNTVASVQVSGGSITTKLGLLTVAGNLTVSAGATLTGNVQVGGQYVASGNTSIGGALNVANGGSNSGVMTIATGATTQFGGGTFANVGTISFSGGTLTTNGTLVNNNTLSGSGTMSGTGSLINNGQLNVGSGGLTLALTGAKINNNTITVGAGTQLYLENGVFRNAGSFSLSAGLITGSGELRNDVGGVLSATGTILTPFSNRGSLLLTSGTLNIASPFSNSGQIQISANASNLVGGLLTNDGTIEGFGKIGNNIDNGGTIEVQGGTLTLAGAVSNTASGLIAVATANKLLATGGLSSNAGVIELSGGTFDNGGNPLANAGRIVGAGTFRSGGLTNTGSITLTGGPTFVDGSVTNELTGSVRAVGDSVIFSGDFVNQGSFKNTAAKVTFAGKFSGNGSYVSDPADNYFTSLAIGLHGSLSGGLGDRFFISGDFLTDSTENLAWDTALAELHFTAGNPSHRLTVSGLDLGHSQAGYQNNFSWGGLFLASGAGLVLEDGGLPGGALYVRDLSLAGGLSQIETITANGLNIYYDPSRPGNAYLNGQTFELEGGGVLTAVPEPASGLLLLGGTLLLGRRARSTRKK